MKNQEIFFSMGLPCPDYIGINHSLDGSFNVFFVHQVQPWHDIQKVFCNAEIPGIFRLTIDQSAAFRNRFKLSVSASNINSLDSISSN